MSLDRNAKDATRLRRNAQRTRAGGVTASIKTAAPLSISTAGAVSLSLSSVGALQVTSNQLAVKVDGTTIKIVSNQLTVGGLAISPLTVGTAGGSLAFFGATPVAVPTVTGSMSGGAALPSLLSALATLGLIVNSTTP